MTNDFSAAFLGAAAIAVVGALASAALLRSNPGAGAAPDTHETIKETS